MNIIVRINRLNNEWYITRARNRFRSPRQIRIYIYIYMCIVARIMYIIY